MLNKKILIICPQLNEEYIHYQPWKQIINLASELIKLDFKVVIGTEATNSSKINNIPIMNFQQSNLRNLNQNSLNKIFDFKPDLIFWIGNSLTGIYLKKIDFQNIPLLLYISTVPLSLKNIFNMNINSILQLNIFDILFSLPLLKKLVKNLNNSKISGLIVANNTIATNLKKLKVTNKIFVSPFFFNADFPNTIKSEKNSNKSFTLCYIGPYSIIRGSDIILELIKMIKKQNLKIKLNFLLRTINNHDEKKLIQKIKKMNISDHISLHSGILSREELNLKINESDLILFPTKYVWNEPPLTILEVMKLGKPVITTNVCGLPELVGENGFIVNPNALSFYTMIKKLYFDKKLLEIKSKEGKKFATSLGGWSEMANWTKQIMLSVINKN